MRECSSSRQFICIYSCLCFRCRVLWYNVPTNVKDLLETTTDKLILFKDSLICLRGSATLHTAQIKKEEIQVQLRFSLFSYIIF